ncbi:hypothetical protein [Amycolatopsis sp. FDAARGOS 1241]|uniref:hypothetical protein n=1 Tax=Amycolatopsis sp. FDAARGOS 1241 TaxID=2778070 RepID=UPI00195241A5|nr:hypothetical protein [Amycolatopsis sp. FDAARGOS 1241]QRP47984.1 hypothetical protein I6J71_08905 [Amycolatopsis sp. FDAARGOS 1241]
MTDELILTESKTMRAQYAGRIDVLDKVGALALADGIHATTEQVAHYYEITVKTLESLIEDNRDELEHNGLRKIDGEELALFKGASGIASRAKSLLVFPRTAILNVGQLLTGSTVAKTVRTYLLAVEATATAEHRESAIKIVRFQELTNYKNILHSLKLGGAVREDYALVQDTIYLTLFGKTARQIKTTQEQQTGTPRKRGGGFCKSDVAKDFMTVEQLELLDALVAMTIAQIRLYHRDGATPAQMLDAVHRAAGLIDCGRLGGAA